MGEPTGDKAQFSRRDFLRLGKVVGGLLFVPQIPDLALDAGLALSTNGMEMVLPSEFAEISIPKENQNYRNPEFSPMISHNWLLEQFHDGKIPEDSLLRLSGSMDNEQGKNFMPINKAGTYYHCMNILTLAATCMDPWVIKGMVISYYNEQRIGGMDHRTEHGMDKVKADIAIAESAGRIKRMVDWET